MAGLPRPRPQLGPGGPSRHTGAPLCPLRADCRALYAAVAPEALRADLSYRQTVNERGLEPKAGVAELLLDAARVFAETLEPERVYERFHELLGDFVGHDGVVVSSYDAADGLIRCDYAWVDGNRLDPEILPPVPLNRRGGGMQSRVIVTGEPLLVNDVAERVQEPGGTYYDVDREGHVRKRPRRGRRARKPH